MPYIAASLRATVTDRQNEGLLGDRGCLTQRGGGAAPLFNLLGRKRVGAGTDPTVKMTGGCELREYISDGFSL